MLEWQRSYDSSQVGMAAIVRQLADSADPRRGEQGNHRVGLGSGVAGRHCEVYSADERLCVFADGACGCGRVE